MEKPCRTCGQRFPTTAEYFPPERRNRDGFSNKCRSCTNAHHRHWSHERTKQPKVTRRTKTCSQCQRTLPATSEYFSQQVRSVDRLNPQCRDCTRAYNQRYRLRRSQEPKVALTSKHCPGCQRDLPATAEYFARDLVATDGLRSRCRACQYAQRVRPERLPKVQAIRRRCNQRVRLAALKHYSGGSMQCACCGQKRIEFLTLDHIGGGGAEHRRRDQSAYSIARWVRNHGYPPGFQVLCFNCNMSLGVFGYCGHHPQPLPLPTPGMTRAEKKRLYGQRWRRQLKHQVLAHYSCSSDPCCAWCGETAIEFLALDHIAGDGAQHRKQLGGRARSGLYLWARKNDFPPLFRVLCHNCNSARAMHGLTEADITGQIEQAAD